MRDLDWNNFVKMVQPHLKQYMPRYEFHKTNECLYLVPWYGGSCVIGVTNFVSCRWEGSQLMPNHVPHILDWHEVGRSGTPREYLTSANTFRVSRLMYVWILS